MSDDASNPPSSGTSSTPSPPRVPDHQLLRCIGRGSYGEVWLARNVMGQWRAVKLVHRSQFAGDEHLYEREFEGIRRYEPISRSHESLMQVLHVGRDEAAECFYYVMELADAVPSSEFQVSGSAAEAQLATRNPEPETYVPRTLRSEVKRRGRLPPEECVQIGVALAAALDQLHGRELVHRDIKPANIIFVGGRPKLADIGLVADFDATRSFVGTQGYVPREGPGDASADLFALGKVLYEMATGRDRFDFPALPSFGDLSAREQKGLRELNAVILKACADDPKQRHRDAAELRDELLRLQLGESIERQRTLERAYRRLKVVSRWAGAVLLVAALAFAVWTYRSVALRQALLREIGLARAGAREAGWFSNNWSLIQRAADLGGGREALTEAAGALAGLDAPSNVKFWDTGGGSAAFAPNGTLLVGGDSGSPNLLIDTNGTKRDLAARVDGPVGWTAEGVALQFSAEPNACVLSEVDPARRRRVFPLAPGERVNSKKPGGPLTNSLMGPILAMTPDGRRVASAVSRDGHGRVLAWDASSGDLLGEASWNAVTLAFSADGSVLAASDGDGTIQVFSVPGVTAGRTLHPLTRPVPIRCLALTRNPVIRDTGHDQTKSWLLAAGYHGGEVVIWDLDTGLPHAFCRGMSWTVTALAFTQDGLTLASAGRNEARLWDVMRGQLLLSLHGGGGGNARALAFNADGSRLVWGTEVREERPCVSVWKLNWHRGIRVLRGLKTNARWVWFSPDSSRVAALSDDWLVGVWETGSGRLLSLFEVPHGVYADNAAGTFDNHSKQFAFAAGMEARLFDVETGRVLQKWPLDKPGLFDQLRFDKAGNLWFVRRGADSEPPSERRWRVYALPTNGLPEMRREQRETNWWSYITILAAGAERFFVGTLDREGQRPVLRAYDTASGNELKQWVIAGHPEANALLDPTGRYLAYVLDGSDGCQLIRISDWEEVGVTPDRCSAIGPSGAICAVVDRQGYVVCDLDGPARGLPLGQDWTPDFKPSFSPNGRLFAWGSHEGDVLLADLAEVQRWLSLLGLSRLMPAQPPGHNPYGR